MVQNISGMEMLIIFDKTRIIPSIVRYEQISTAEKSQCQRVNLLVGTINNLHEIVGGLQESGKKVFVHIDMIGGIGKDSDAVSFFSKSVKVDGIITTKSSIVSAAKACGLLSVQRIFAIDTAALKTAIKTAKANQPDELELMPGLMPKIIRQVKALIDKPLIVGGLISSEREVVQAFENKADYVSIGNDKLW